MTDEMPDTIWAWNIDHDQGCWDQDPDAYGRKKYIRADTVWKPTLADKARGWLGIVLLIYMGVMSTLSLIYWG